METNPQELRFYYTMSLQIGSGLRYLSLALKQQQMNLLLKEQNQILDFAAYHDELTGLYNRAGVMQQMMTKLHKAKDGTAFAAVMGDLDHLKQINDTFGHDAGDSAIRTVSQILTDVFPQDSPVGRSGGDEFTAMIDIEDESRIEDIRKRVKEACQKYDDTAKKPYYLGISLGFHIFSKDETVSLSDMLKKADENLYESKKARRKSVVR